MRATLVLVAACWTGTDAAPATPANRAPEPPPLPVAIRFERTECLGTCPAYVVEIHGDGSIVWTGRSNVAAVGMRRARIDRRRLEALVNTISASGFFELDSSGHSRANPACVASNGSMSCTFTSIVVCSDTSHAVITVRRGSEVNVVDDAHCSDDGPLVGVENMIDRVAGTDVWIGR